jgi:hypothetical protein
MDQNSVLGISAIVISVAGSILGIVNHKRIRSNCCGRTVEASIDVENTTPQVGAKAPALTVRQPTE